VHVHLEEVKFGGAVDRLRGRRDQFLEAFEAVVLNGGVVDFAVGLALHGVHVVVAIAL
jgi:hypothetical protein